MIFTVYEVSDMSHLTLDLTDHQHQSLKALAALQGKTIKQYAIDQLLPGQADGGAAWEQLKALLRARIDSALAGNMSIKAVDEIIEEELARADPA
jgi:hypothetical protein